MKDDLSPVNKITPEDIFEAVKTTGYFMEYEVAETFRSFGYSAVSPMAFQDVDEQKSREIDVFAGRIFETKKAGIKLHVMFICECKNNRNYPIVFFCEKNDPIQEIINWHEFIFPEMLQKWGLMGVEYLQTFNFLVLFKLHPYFKQKLKALQFTKIEYGTNKWRANTQGVFNEMVYPLVKAYHYYRRLFLTSIPVYDPDKDVVLFFPIVITSGDLYTINMSGSPLEIEKVNNICFTRHFRSKAINGDYRVFFVKQDTLKDFVDNEVGPLIEQILKIAEEEPEIILEKEQWPSHEKPTNPLTKLQNAIIDKINHGSK